MHATEQVIDALRKRQATCQARIALLGGTLINSHDDAGRPTWIISRWSLTREFSDIAEIEVLLDRMGAPK